MQSVILMLEPILERRLSLEVYMTYFTKVSLWILRTVSKLFLLEAVSSDAFPLVLQSVVVHWAGAPGAVIANLVLGTPVPRE